MAMGTEGKDIEYRTGSDRIKGYLAYPDDGKDHRGVIVIHEIFGLDQHTRSVADRMASEGARGGNKQNIRCKEQQDRCNICQGIIQ